MSTAVQSDRRYGSVSGSRSKRMGKTHKKKALLYSSDRNVFNKEKYIACFISIVLHQHLVLVFNLNMNEINFSCLLSFLPC